MSRGAPRGMYARGSPMSARAQYQMNQHAQSTQIVSPQKLQELVKQIDDTEQLDADVAAFLVEMAEEFVDSVTMFACNLAQHRKSDTLEVKDMQLHLETNWNIRIPGYQEIQPSKKPPGISDQHKKRLDMVKKSQKQRR